VLMMLMLMSHHHHVLYCSVAHDVCLSARANRDIMYDKRFF